MLNLDPAMLTSVVRAVKESKTETIF